jgi:ceramide glucosyltransferase
VARSLSSGRSWEQAEERLGRWLTVIRAQRPALLPSYPLLFLATAPLVALGALGASPAAVAAALLPRLAVALVASAAAGRRLSLLDAALGDLLLAGAFLRALRSREVVWRDVPLTIGRGGLLAEKGS